MKAILSWIIFIAVHLTVFWAVLFSLEEFRLFLRITRRRTLFVFLLVLMINLVAGTAARFVQNKILMRAIPFEVASWVVFVVVFLAVFWSILLPLKYLNLAFKITQGRLIPIILLGLTVAPIAVTVARSLEKKVMNVIYNQITEVKESGEVQGM